MATIDVKDASGATVSVGKYLPGRAAAADSSPAVLSTEDLAAITGTSLTGTLMELTTNATGTTYTAFGSQACKQLTVFNARPSAVDLQVRRGSSGATLCLPAGAFWVFVGLTNANQIEVRRWDTSNTQVTVSAEAVA